MRRMTLAITAALALGGCGSKPEGNFYWDCIGYWEDEFECCGETVEVSGYECGNEDDLAGALGSCDRFDLSPCEFDTGYDADACTQAEDAIVNVEAQYDDYWSGACES